MFTYQRNTFLRAGRISRFSDAIFYVKTDDGGNTLILFLNKSYLSWKFDILYFRDLFVFLAFAKLNNYEFEKKKKL